MRLTVHRLSSLVIVSVVTSLFAFNCGGGSTNPDSATDGKKDGADSGTGGSGGKAGTGGSGSGGVTGTGGAGTGGIIGTGGTGTGGKPDAATDALADHPDAGTGGSDAKTDVPADVPAADAPVDNHPDTAVEAAPDTAPEAAPETAPEAAPETAPEAAPDTPEQTFLSIAPCNNEGAYVTAPTTITFPTGSSPAPYTPNCLKVSKNAMVTWMGNFADHPLSPRDGGTAGSPIQLTNTNVGSKSFTFPNTGFFPFRCTVHSSMTGVVWVTD